MKMMEIFLSECSPSEQQNNALMVIYSRMKIRSEIDIYIYIYIYIYKIRNLNNYNMLFHYDEPF